MFQSLVPETGPFSHLWKFSVELEGGWDEKPRDFRDYWHSDGSVNASLGGERYGEHEPDCSCECHYGDDPQQYCDDCEDTGSSDLAGEIALPPYRNVEQFTDACRRAWPARVDGSCGLHVHVSCAEIEDLNITRYSRLTSKRFEKFLMGQMEKFARREHYGTTHRFWRRFRGQNNYCQRDFNPDAQLLYGDRYTAINFCAYQRHGTVEFRFLPAYTSWRAGTRAALHVVGLTNLYIKIAESKKPEILFERLLDAEDIGPELYTAEQNFIVEGA